MEWLYVICFVVAIGSFIFSFSLTKKEKTVAMIIALVAFILGFVFVGIYVSMNGGAVKVVVEINIKADLIIMKKTRA